jgi:spermidine synthase
MGFFAIVAQALLLRLFLGILDGNELGLGCFFGAWLIWVAIGAATAGGLTRACATLTRRFEFMPLWYIPAFVLQMWLINHARALTGVQSYEPFPLHTMVTVAFWGNAPVSFCTGFLFTLGCKWLTALRGLVVAKVYTWECVGSFVGGVSTTILLDRGMSAESVFSWTALLMTTTLTLYLIKQKSYAAGFLIPMLAVGLMASNAATHWERHTDLNAWKRMLPVDSYRGSFITPDSKYLYGEYSGQFNVVSAAIVADTIPDTEHASEVAAVHLAQHPSARRFLVIGRGAFSICRRLLTLPQVDLVTWLDPDPAYTALLLSRLPQSLKMEDARLDIPARDIRNWLTHTDAQYDVIVLSLPNPTTLALNRYFTRDFFQLLKARLPPDGIVGVRVSAGENYMGRELVNVGASVFQTLRAAFTRLAIKPGEETWLIASDSQPLTNAPTVLRDRLASIRDIGRLYPPSALMSLYLPQRAAYQMGHYEQAMAGPASELLFNTDRSPKALLHSLAVSGQESGAAVSIGNLVVAIAVWGRPLAPFGLLLFFVLRLLYGIRHPNPFRTTPAHPCPSRSDSHALIVTSGAVGMGSTIVLLHMYQSAFGSLFLHVGLITAFYMLGLALGSHAAASFLSSQRIMFNRILSFTMFFHIVFFAGMACPGQYPAPVVFVLAIFISGILGGVYAPLAAYRLNAAGLSPDAAGARLEALDHVGGALGGIAAGLIVLPLYGTAYALGLLALLLLTNVVALLPPQSRRIHVPTTDSQPDRYIGMRYASFGLVMLVLAGGLLLRRGASAETQQAFLTFSRRYAGEFPLQEERATLANGRRLDYFRLTARASEAKPHSPSYAFMTDAMAPDVFGYGGTMILGVMVADDGTLGSVEILPSRETPAYLDYLRPWLNRLRGKKLFVSQPLHDVDAVTGATMTSAAVLGILRRCGPVFAQEVLGTAVRPVPITEATSPPYRAALWLMASALAALILRQRPSWLRRRVLLVLIVFISGIVLNSQYSLAQVFALVDLAIPPAGWNAAFILVVCVPVIVSCFGNLYCGYMCPFGALQEIIGDIRVAAGHSHPRRAQWEKLRFVKYAILGGLLLLFGISHQHGLAACDPLVTVFSRISSSSMKCLAILLAGLSFFFPRFWCRCLCPAGAFLSLFNSMRAFRRLSPTIAPSSCIYGIQKQSDLDCLCCDRCRSRGRQDLDSMAPSTPLRISPPSRIWMTILVLTLTGIIGGQAILIWRQEAGRRSTGMEPGISGGRTVDLEQLRSGMHAGRLSEREARFYRVAPAGSRAP